MLARATTDFSDQASAKTPWWQRPQQAPCRAAVFITTSDAEPHEVRRGCEMTWVQIKFYFVRAMSRLALRWMLVFSPMVLALNQGLACTGQAPTLSCTFTPGLFFPCAYPEHSTRMGAGLFLPEWC